MRMKRSLIRLLVATAVAVMTAVAVGASPPAADHGPIYTVNYGGGASFADYGDYVYACDYESDGKSVAVEVTYTPGGTDYVEFDRRSHWSGSECARFNFNMAEDSLVAYRVCLGDHGAPGGIPAEVWEVSCSSLYYTYA